MQKTGEWREIERIKANAAPIDNATKFAWADDDYETVTVWHEYTPAEIMEQRRRRVDELNRNLSVTDYIVIKVAEGAATWDEYPHIKEQRQAWRDEINALEEGNDGET